MKKLILLLAVFGIYLTGHAQGLALGIRAGVNNGNLTTKLPNIVQGPVHNGFTIGAFGRASLLGFFVQPEINFSQRIGEFQKVGVGSYTNTLNTIDINALVGLSVLGVVRVNLGPTLMTFVSTSQVGDKSIKDAYYGNDFYNSTAIGFQIGAGVDLGKLCIDLRYDTNLSNLGMTSVYSSYFGHGSNYSTGFGMFQFTLGYKIIKI